MTDTNWEEHYQTGDMPWEKGAPSPGLVDFLAENPGLAKGKVLVPGCGTGHDVRAWQQAGFPTTGFDLAASAIRIATQRNQEAGLPANYQMGDFLSASAPQPFDWVFEHTLYCAISPGHRGDYVQACLRWLKPSGQYLAVNYFIPDQDGPPFGTDRDEIWRRFSPHFELIKEWVPRSYPNRTGLERMFWWRRKT